MELSAYFRFVAALVFILGVIGLLALLARRFIPGARNVNRRGVKRRLSIVEVIPVDTKRRLVLVKRDDTEHLIMLGPNTDTVVERNIGMHFSDMLDPAIHASDETQGDNTDILKDSHNNIDKTDRKDPA